MSKMKFLTVGFLMMGALLLAGISEPINQSKFIPDTSNEYKPQALASSFTDGKAVISNVTGTAKILRSGSDEWTSVSENDTIKEGDQIRTDNNASVDVIFHGATVNSNNRLIVIGSYGGNFQAVENNNERREAVWRFR